MQQEPHAEMMPPAAALIAFQKRADLMAVMNLRFALSLLSPLLTTPAIAASSPWYAVEGGAVRLITTAPDSDGGIRGVLQIDLKSGWKTYWRDPGDAGVPPSIDVSASTNVGAATLDYPAPHRFDDGYSIWAGYKEPVSFPVTFAVPEPGKPSKIEADVFLGICETICIPVQTRFSIDPGTADDPADVAAVDAAVAALPGPEQPDFGVTMLAGNPDEVLVEAAYAGDPDTVDFFLAGSDGYYFGPPKKLDEGGRLTFSVPILDRPKEKPASGTLAYTLVTEAGAVAGQLPFP